MQGFNRYFPPDFDPKAHDTLNRYHGKHALGDRARKIDQGILITRFELPFNVWCGGCNAHIGMGVRYNAEKKKVGNYYSTPIYAFRCKCHLCGHWFTVETDPKNTCYVVTEGARQQMSEWDDTDNGGIVLDKKDPTKPPDAFESVEKKVKDKQVATESKDRLVELYHHKDSQWSDPFTLSQKMRSKHRQEKGRLISESRSDDALRLKYSLPDSLVLPSIDLSNESKLEAQNLIRRGQEEIKCKRKREEAETGYEDDQSSTIGSSATNKLKSRLIKSTRLKVDPFLNNSDPSSSTKVGTSTGNLTINIRRKKKIEVGEDTQCQTSQSLPKLSLVAAYDSD